MNSDHQQQPPEPNSPVELGFQEQKDEKNSNLTIKLPSSFQDFKNGNQDFQEEEEPKTPTSSDQKIPATTTCPPAPRKPKTVAKFNNNKRKTPSFQRVSVDLMVMINAMFPPAAGDEVMAVADLAGADDRHGKKIKKANVTTGS